MQKFIVAMLGFILLLPFEHAGAQHKLESWYIYFGLGYADPQYPDELDTALNDVADLPSVTHVSISLDLIGFYWPLSPRTIIGPIINAFGDRYDVENTNVDLQLSGYSIAFSTMHFLSDQIGKGLFVRGDVGPTRFVVDVGGGGTSLSQQSDWGFGVLVGAGYSLPISDGTRVTLNANYAFRKVQEVEVGVVALSIGGLF